MGNRRLWAILVSIAILFAFAMPSTGNLLSTQGASKIPYASSVHNIDTGMNCTTVGAAQARIVEHRITAAELERLKEYEGVCEGENYNVIINGHGTGLSAPTEEEWAQIAAKAYVVDTISLGSLSPPVFSSVDWSTTPWFPPIGDQDGQGSCVSFAVGYYTKTFQEAIEHGWNLTGARWVGVYGGYPTPEYQDKIISPAFIYHLTNWGLNTGTSFYNAINLVCSIGACSWAEMPWNPSDQASWPSESAWRQAAYYRGASTQFQWIYVNPPSGILSLKSLIASGNLAVIAVNASQYQNLTSQDVWTLDNYNPDGTNHANTVVGYDDNMTYFENGTSSKGAFKIANSWGVGGWENVPDGCYWISYKAMSQRVEYVMFYDDRIGYVPTLTSSFRIEHPLRGDCEITIGMGTHDNPDVSKNFTDYICGGNFSFCPNNIVFDITEFKDVVPNIYGQQFFIRVNDTGTSTTGTILYFAVEDTVSSYYTSSSDPPVTTVNSGYVFADLIALARTSTYYVGTIGQPARLDPARAYDTASGDIIQNVYQPLIWYGDKHPINFTAGVGYNLQTSDISDLTKYTAVIATQVPNDTNGGIIRNYTGVGDSLWTFTLNPNAQFPSWTAANGTVMPAHNVTVDDVVYSFQRQMVYDSSASPDWMWIGTAFNPGWGGFNPDALGPYATYANGTFVSTADETAVGNLIKGWVYASGGNNVTFHFLYPYPDVAMYQIFAQTWGCILEKSWVIEHGGWTGVFYAGWSNDYRHKPSNSYSELDQYKDPAVYGAAGSKYTSGNHDIPNMLGTGPYTFTSWDKTTKTWRIDYNPNYWRGWGNAGDKAGNYIKTVIEQEIDPWPTRKMLFLTGEFDVAVVPTANMHDLLQTGSNYNPIAGINLVYNIPTLSNDAFFFTMNVSTSSAYQSYVGPPGAHTTGPIATFFADDHIRRAFAWAINYTDYINSAYFGEAIQHGSWWVTGLTPAAANDSFLTLRNLNLANMQAELDQAALINGHNVSQNGFDVTFLYNTGNPQRMIACQALADAWNSLGSKYHVNVVGVGWPTFSNLINNRGMPGYSTGWLADFADAADFAGTYMSSSASSGFSYFQGPPYPADQAIIDAEVTQAATETNVTARVNEYKDLEQRYWTDCISIPLGQPLGRRFARDWVQGWYYNPLLPGLSYAYDLYKAILTPLQPVTLNITHSITPIQTYSAVYWYKGQALIGNGNGNPAIFKYSITVERTDANTNVPLLAAVISLERVNGSYAGPGGRSDAYQFMNSTIVYLPVGGNATVELWWWEDGSYPQFFRPYPDASNPLNYWNISAVTVPLGAQQTDPSLLQINDGQTIAEGPLTGDIDGNGVVNILDAIKLGLHFLETPSSPGWNQGGANADINGDGVVNILDAIILGLHFLEHYP